MEYDSGSSCEGRLKDLEDSEAPEQINRCNDRAEREISTQPSTSLRWYVEQTPNARPSTILPVVAKKTLSSQVMEYYQKYSQNSGLGRYFSLPETGANCQQSTSFHSRTHGAIPDSIAGIESYVILADEERSRQDALIPRERRKWARPPLIGQPSSSDGAITSNYVVDSRTPSPIIKRPVNETIPEERNESSRETLAETKDNETKPSVSPTSSVASHKPLEWDSGADVGYFNALVPRTKDKDKKLCTIERMALARGCSVAMRLDPEGTNESTTSSRTGMKNSMKPDANSTPLVGHISVESESEIEITPIVKNHSSAVMKVRDEKSREVCNEPAASCEANRPAERKSSPRAPPVQIKYPTEGSRPKETRHAAQLSPLKKSSSMNLLALPLSRLSLKRSQSELNLRVKEKKILPLIFDSTSSIATIVNKPITCDKFIQTSLESCSRESIGIQVEVTDSESEKAIEGTNESDELNKAEEKREEKREDEEKDEEKPPLPKRASSLVPKSLHSILKNSSNTYSVRDRNVPLSIPEVRNPIENPDNFRANDHSKDNEARADGARARYRTRGGGKTLECNSSSEPSMRNESSSTRSEILVEEMTEENATGRASNSFEYFPGHVYQNVANGSTSQVSSCDTGRESRCSTMPNTSSSIDEKLWGDSDSLVRDLERSVNILKSLVDANKCDKQVKKRLIHHVIKRLVTAKYTDDRIEHDLEENVPWNPADTRDKVYRNDIIQALVSNKQQQQQTTDSSAEDWRPRKRNSARGNSVSPKKNLSKETRVLKEMIELAASSRESTINSDKFPFDGHTDRTLMDGRKARMGLRSEDQRRDTNTDGEKSQSSECFMPQLQNQHKNKSTNLFYSMEKSNEKTRDSSQNLARDVPTVLTTTTAATASTATATSTSTSHRNLSSNRIVLVKERRRTETNETDWRLPTTMSERRFELGRCSNSESGDAKLINYAEMEKRNQLVWITNEISHLCNLKRLLEEPNKTETRSRRENSPSKRFTDLPVSRWVDQAHTEQNFSNGTERAQVTGSDAAVGNVQAKEPRQSVLENQWSSHGNLASAPSKPKPSTKREEEKMEKVGHTRKRNSCTQTGSDGGPSGHSKTGGEIVSATLPVFTSTCTPKTMEGMGLGTRDVCVQTRSISPQKMANPLPTSSQIVTEAATRSHSTNCPNRNQTKSHANEKTCTKNRGSHVCYCQRYAAHSRHRACIKHSPQKSTREHSKNCPRKPRSEERPIITQPIVRQIPASAPKSMDSRKEAKNQLNATCKSNYAIRQLPAKNKVAACPRCDEENISPGTKNAPETIETWTKSSGDNDSSDACIFPTDCNCIDREHDELREAERDRGKEDETPSSSSESGMETGKKVQPENLSSCPKCACDSETNPRIDDRLSGGGGNKQDSRNNSSTAEAKDRLEQACKSCRTCGTIWPVKDGKNPSRKCKCSQDYLKPVAYELKFDETIKDKPKIIGNKKTARAEKILTKAVSANAKTQSRATQSAPINEKLLKNCVCAGEEEKNIEKDGDDHTNNDQLPGTLKDFLATNRPEFLENVETRRRYMSELSELRQLKREKRKQFLAMAGSSVLLKPQRPPKGPAANVQKKLSEYEMKLRLRARYLRLNEVRNKRRQREKEEDARRNHLMAKLFGQKLQQKVLKGQVDLSQSVSVISNL